MRFNVLMADNGAMGMYESCMTALKDADYCRDLAETAQKFANGGILFETRGLKRVVQFQAEELTIAGGEKTAVLLFTINNGFTHIVAIRLKRVARGFELTGIRIVNKEIVALLNPSPLSALLYLDLATDLALRL